MDNRFKTCDLFAGAGGIRLGFEKAGFDTVFSNDYDEYCAKTYDLNFKQPKVTVKDIREINPEEIPDFDVLLAGFPCQPFSTAGYQKGFKDKRNGDLFFEVIRILREKKPVAVFLENVKNIKSHDDGKTFETITAELRSAGYKTKDAVLNTRRYANIPQNRERAFVLGFLNDVAYDNFSFPKEVELSRKIKDFLDESVDEKFYYKEYDKIYPILRDAVKFKHTVYQYRQTYVRENKNAVCPTLTANMGGGGHNVPIILNKKGIRKLTPRECFRLQGFPESFKLPNISASKLYKQAGNSVTVPLVRRIAKQMKKALSISGGTKPLVL